MSHKNLVHITNLQNVVPYLNSKEVQKHFPLKWGGRDSSTVQTVLKSMDTLAANRAGITLLQECASQFGLGGNLNRLAMAATGRPGKNRNDAGVNTGSHGLVASETSLVCSIVASLNGKLQILPYNGKVVPEQAVRQGLSIIGGYKPTLTDFSSESELAEEERDSVVSDMVEAQKKILDKKAAPKKVAPRKTAPKTRPRKKAAPRKGIQTSAKASKGNGLA